ncbi:ribosomal protein S5 [Columba livia]|uniref:Ribosomal protein S5 n=1 Tax=Columba livia TaxID=8932 RepID=A0A2I0LHT4_COLLI|nr:ribosomal protein S5 [Columba livia]
MTRRRRPSQDYIAVKEKYAKYLPHSAGRYAAKRFRKAQCPIVERLTNSMMMHGRNNGKKLMTVRIVKHAFEIIHLLTGEVATGWGGWLLCTGAREAAFRNIKTIAECLADELINAAKGSSNSYAIKKKDELERVAKSNR